MTRHISTLFLVGLLLSSVALGEQPTGNVIRPKRVDAKVKGCQISETGEYQATAGDLIEIEYTFPIVPTCIPEEIARETDRGAVYPSKLGIRNLIVPRIVGTGTYLFYFDARDAGTGTAMVVVDDVKYVYRFEIAEARKRKQKSKD